MLWLALGSEAFAQAVMTAPVGSMTYAVAANSMISLGVPLLRAGVWTGVVGAGDSGTVTLLQDSGQPLNLASLISSSSPYYIEVVGHLDGVTTTLVGDRFEVDETATVATANNVLALDGASALNTMVGGDFSSLANYRVTIRPHWTLASFFGTGIGTNLNASTSIQAADQVLAWNGTGFSIYYFRNTSTPQWRNPSTGTASQDKAIIPPGVGVYFKRASGAYSRTITGEVRVNRFVRVLDNTSQLIANGFPVDLSPGDLHQNTSNGYVSSTYVGTADQLLTLVSGGFSIYYYRSGATPQWRNVSTGTTNQTSAKFYGAAEAVLYRPKGSPGDMIQDVPFSLD